MLARLVAASAGRRNESNDVSVPTLDLGFRGGVFRRPVGGMPPVALRAAESPYSATEHEDRPRRLVQGLRAGRERPSFGIPCTADGTIDFPYLDRLTVAGLEPQQIVDVIKKGLIEKRILVDPQVMLVVTQYNSKKVSIVGAVSKPGSLPWTEG